MKVVYFHFSLMYNNLEKTVLAISNFWS
uniref:Uncharacterized protein n=1 Tax=Rhizophora mucronata TaxID=61149 RepID=A0A2P2QZT8_RHIMU